MSSVDFSLVSVRRWSSQINPVSGRVYARASINGKLFYMHRHIVEVINGGLIAGMVVHHKDGNGLNNTFQSCALLSIDQQP